MSSVVSFIIVSPLLFIAVYFLGYLHGRSVESHFYASLIDDIEVVKLKPEARVRRLKWLRARGIHL